ncbi:unnamed protein product [Rotaria socialis]|uniref:ATP-dependent DNA helicase n=1 Tax=Rotaria socialis TaxID=392032 RepID=A0A820NI97_9BILA|nr:unnamed protein product [Rotaria socialis]
MKSNYESKIKEGPTHICSSCGGLWFEYSIREFTIEMLTNKGLKKEFIDTVCCLKNTIINLCATCRKDIILNKVPTLCLSNGLAFYEIPNCLKILTELEERLISPRIPFMVIRSLGSCKQFGLKGNLVNVPMNVDTNVSILPRSFSDTHTIQLKLMRQMKNKNAFMYETIRPKVVHTAVKYLVEQALYKDEGIVISHDWINEYSNERENFIINDDDKKFDEDENINKDFEDEDERNECDDKPINPSATETLLNDEVDDQNDVGIKFAPGENNRPISILMDLKVDELTFPKIYCGEQRKIKSNVKLTYGKDPVTCVRYFEQRLKCLWEILLASCGSFEGNGLEDKYIRVEFQVRGSQHIHVLIWLKNAPKYDKNNPKSIEQCIEFIDKLISVNAKLTEFSDELINLQRHKHSHTCKKHVKNRIKCRFGIPYFPIRKTMILEPFTDDEKFTKKEREEISKNKQNVIKELENISKDKDNSLTFEEFLEHVNMNEEEYIKMIRSELEKAKVFLKRAPNEIRINAYNPMIMSLHRANMDIQFILVPYACLTYCVNYISKSENGMSKLLREAFNELQKGNHTVKERLRVLANKFLNSSEISAQEAVYHILSIPLSINSRSTIFINTNRPENRISMVKSDEILQKLDPDSKDIFVQGLIDMYVNRPDDMKNVCFVDFASLYNVTKRIAYNDGIAENSDDEEVIDNEFDEFNPLKMKNSKGWIKRRTKQKIIRFRNFQLHQDPENYYREQLMLFHPWNNEQKDLIDINHEEVFESYKDSIRKKRSEYVHHEANKFEKAVEENKETEDDSDIDDTNNEYDQDKNEFFIYKTGNNEGDIFLERGINTHTKKVEHFNVPKIIPNIEYQEIMRNLNDSQIKYTLNVMNLIKNGDEQFFHFINGGAGVGKSTLIKAVYQSILRFYNSLPGSNPETIHVALCAPTGKAAALIGGMTLNSFLSLPVNQYEISMVDFTMFQQVDSRLQQIMKVKKPFGGISLIVLGDFNQLRPVGDKYIFQYNNSYNALVDNPLWSLLRLFELTEIMRQKDDKPFAMALSNLAKGMMTSEDINLLKSRIVSVDKLEGTENAIRVFRSNAEVDAYNAKALANLNTEGATANAYDFCVDDGLASIKEKVLSNVKNLKTTETYGLPLKIDLKVGAKYMMTVNFDTEDGLVNGACGKLIVIDYGKLKKTNETVPCRLWIKFNEEKLEE